MKQMQILTQEPYEAPAILDIMPVTMVSGQGEASGGAGGDDYPDPTDPNVPGPGGEDDEG